MGAGGPHLSAFRRFGRDGARSFGSAALLFAGCSHPYGQRAWYLRFRAGPVAFDVINGPRVAHRPRSKRQALRYAARSPPGQDGPTKTSFRARESCSIHRYRNDSQPKPPRLPRLIRIRTRFWNGLRQRGIFSSNPAFRLLVSAVQSSRPSLGIVSSAGPVLQRTSESSLAPFAHTGRQQLKSAPLFCSLSGQSNATLHGSGKCGLCRARIALEFVKAAQNKRSPHVAIRRKSRKSHVDSTHPLFRAT